MAHPEAIFVQVRTACNARCINCPHYFTYGKKGHHPSGVMSHQVWQKIVSDIKEMDYRGQVGLYLHHEPLLDSELFEKIRQVNEQTNAFVVISTNGALLDKNRTTGLIKSSPLIVHININSADKKQHEDMTGLSYEAVIKNTRHFITEAQGKVHVELNCPVMPGVDVGKLQELFPGPKVNSDYWANSRGGLLPQISGKDFRSRFKIEECCIQPVQNFNILHDGSVVVCCMDWMHESKKDFPNILDASIEDIYNSDIMRAVMNEFKQGVYRRYKMCEACSVEMGFDISTERQIKSDKKMLKILLTNHHLLDLTGSEIFTCVVADFLQRNGHEVTVYSKYIDRTKGYFDLRNIQVVDDLEEVRDKGFDVAHVHHNINALEVRQMFPSLPMVFLSHGVLPFLEQPPPIDIHVSRYLAVSEEVRDHLIQNGVQSDAVDIFRNVVDSEVFRPLYAINEEPRKALVLSNRIDEETERIIREACDRLNIDCKFVGVRFGEVEYSLIPLYINQADIVFTLGRGVIETMMCARVPVVFDYLGGDGLVTPENAKELMQCNFSGRAHKTKYSTEELIEEIAKYQSRYGEELRNIACQNFCAATKINNLERFYAAAIKKEVPVLEPEDQTFLSNFVHSIDETRNYMGNSLRRRYDGADSRESIVAPCDHLPQENNGIMCKQGAEKSEVHNDIGALYYQLNDFENARKHFEQALKLDPRHVIARKNLADLHVQLGNTVKAVQILQALLQEYPADKEAQDQLKLIRSLCKPDDPEYGDCIQPLIDAQEGQELDQTCSGVPQKPLISVVMPGFTSRENLYRILDLFFINTRYPNYELTVVGPESIKAVIQNQASARRSRIKPFIVPEQLTFVEGMQRAAMSTSGAYIVLFGLHTAATQGWLNTLMKSVSDWPGCGAVTAKTIDMDGHIIEAGYSGLQKEKSEIESAGAGCQHDAPRYNYTCPVMSGSRCCLLVSREALQEAGGLDNVFEDIGSALIDLGLKIIAGGRTIVYQPKSLLVLRNNEPIRSPSSEGNQLDAEECERLRPMIIIPSAGNTSFTTGRKVLVLGVYLADQLNTVDDTVRVLSGSDKFKVIQRWTGLMGSPPTARVDEVTVDTLHERTPKFQIMNAMLKREDLNRFEYVIMTDDDVVLPSGFLDEFIGWQNRLNFAIAQPARTHNSYIDHCIVEQHNGLGARQTLFVEIGPVVSFHRSVFKLVFPFDLASSMGWGYENIWSYRLAEHKAKMGIIDGIPIDHSIRKPVANYTWEQADRQRSELLMKHPHLSLDECLRVVDVYQVGEVS